jgi:AcrR family transcriptional regulator
VATAQAMQEKTRRGDRRREETRHLLTVTAERIFALEGVSNTPLRRITQAAGQRNESAIQYHFGSREAVIQAILDLRTSAVNADRLQMLEVERARADGSPLSARTVARLLVQPLARHLRRAGGESHYIRFLAQLWLDRDMWRRFENRSHDAGVTECLKELHIANPHLPRAIVDQRFALALQMLNLGLAAMEQLISDRGDAYDWKKGEARLANLIDCMESIFLASLSPNTVEALSRTGDFAAR